MDALEMDQYSELQEAANILREGVEDLDDLIDAVRKKGKSSVEHFDTSVFSGEYVTGDVSHHYLEQLELLRCDSAKQLEDDGTQSIIGLHNSP